MLKLKKHTTLSLKNITRIKTKGHQVISLNKLQTLIIFYLIRQGESNTIHSDNIVVHSHPHHHSSRLGQDIDKTNGIRMEIGLEIIPMLAVPIIGISIEIVVVVVVVVVVAVETQGKIIKTIFIKSNGIEMEADIKEERIIEVVARWVEGLEILDQSCNKC